MNNDLISREALKSNIDKFIGYLDEDMIYRIKVVIDNAPTVEPNQLTQDLIDKVNVNIGLAQPINEERPQGKWITDNWGMVHCNYCMREKQQLFNNFCSYCGADMKGGAE